MGPRESRGAAQALPQGAQTAEPRGPRWVWDKGTRLLPCQGDPTGFQNSQEFETGLEGQRGVLTGRDDCMDSQTESRARGGRVAGLEVVLACRV